MEKELFTSHQPVEGMPFYIYVLCVCVCMFPIFKNLENKSLEKYFQKQAHN